jgi:hypothetical protein
MGQGLGLWVLWKKPQSSAFKEGTATFLTLMVGASIALISQTYNIPADTGIFTLTWMLLIIPLVYLMQASLPAAIYLIGITAWSVTYWNNPTKTILFWPLAAMIIPHFIWSLRQEIYALRAALLSLIIIICVSFVASFSLGRSWPGSWIIVFSSVNAIFYFIGTWKFGKITTNWQRPFFLLGAVGLFLLALQSSFRYVWQYIEDYHSIYYSKMFEISAMPDHIITLTIIATAILLFYDNVKRKNLKISLFGAVPVFAIIAYLLNFQCIVLPVLIFNAYLFILSIFHIILGIRNNNLLDINTGIFMLGILIIARFFDTNIGFIIKGLAFIVVGIGFLIANILFIRQRGGVK